MDYCVDVKMDLLRMNYNIGIVARQVNVSWEWKKCSLLVKLKSLFSLKQWAIYYIQVKRQREQKINKN